MRRTVILLLLPAALVSSCGHAASSAPPKLEVRCGLPHHNLVNCSVSGSRFHPNEALTVTYLLHYAQRPTRYRTTARANSHGTFTQSSFHFKVTVATNAYILTVRAVGAKGDKATYTHTAMGD